nr:hypothetical protein BaRGS_020167 [Batillaria attramentaria]
MDLFFSKRYQTVDGTVRILLGDFLPKLEAYRRTRRTPQEAEILLSVVCTSLSLAGLAVTFLTYAVFRPLRTAPGKNNMNLCLALFLAQLLYLVGSGRTEVPGLCKAMGILIHYAWLAAFAAMSVCSFHMWRVFTSLTVAHDSHNDNGQRRLQLYTVYIWGAAAAVVVVTLMVHLVVTGGDSIGYGGQYCYLTTPLGIGLAMGAPVVMVVLANAVFFFLTVHTIRRSPRVTKSRQDEQHVWVYLKLSTLTGITWTLAFLIFFTEVKDFRVSVKAIEYAFTVVNGLQGIFICVSFVLNRRVMALVPERLQKPGKKAAGGSCALSYSQESNALDGDEDLVFTEVNDLLLMPQVALQQDEFVFVKATDGLRVAWLEEEISSQRRKFSAIDRQ